MAGHCSIIETQTALCVKLHAGQVQALHERKCCDGHPLECALLTLPDCFDERLCKTPRNPSQADLVYAMLYHPRDRSTGRYWRVDAVRGEYDSVDVQNLAESDA